MPHVNASVESQTQYKALYKGPDYFIYISMASFLGESNRMECAKKSQPTLNW